MIGLFCGSIIIKYLHLSFFPSLQNEREMEVREREGDTNSTIIGRLTEHYLN